MKNINMILTFLKQTNYVTQKKIDISGYYLFMKFLIIVPNSRSFREK